jgi:hypothetical protein
LERIFGSKKRDVIETRENSIARSFIMYVWACSWHNIKVSKSGKMGWSEHVT